MNAINNQERITINDLYSRAEFLSEKLISIEPAIGPKSEFMRGFDWILMKNKRKAMLEGYNDLVETVLELDDHNAKNEIRDEFREKFGEELIAISRNG